MQLRRGSEPDGVAGLGTGEFDAELILAVSVVSEDAGATGVDFDGTEESIELTFVR